MEAVSAVRRAIEANRWIPPGATLLLAVSGGVDSVVMLDVFARLAGPMQWTLVAAHFDHGLRPDSAQDARFVDELATKKKIASVVGRADGLAARAKQERGGLAAVARAARYAFLADAAAKAKASVIATAHTASDQAETLLLRLVRGAGAIGLAGIPPRRRISKGLHVVRPMLGLTREDVLAHAKRFRLEWREDPGNASPARMRNRVRAELLPLLATFQPDAERVLARAATQAAEAARIVKSRVRRELRGAVASPGSLRLDRGRLLRLPPELGALVIAEALRRARVTPAGRTPAVTASQVEAVAAIAAKGRGRALMAGIEASADRGSVTLTRR